jgi:two-component system, OmpR family, phosphate regulon sensor histidine kinase PhoR
VNKFTPQNLAIVASLILALLTGIATSLSDLLSIEQVNWAHVLLQATVVLSLSYVVFFIAMKFFLYDSVRTIYDSVQELKSSKDVSLEDMRLDEDVLRSVRQDVMQWAVERRNEIEQLKKMEQYRREFVGNVSHELKTPIFNIQGYIFTLLDGGLEDPSINRDYLERASKSVERMITIVEDLDIITQIETGELQPFQEQYDIITQIQEIIQSLELKLAKKNVSVVLETREKSPLNVFADKHLVRQALANLIVNSLKYGKEGGKTTIRLTDGNTAVFLEVEDDGVGIAPNHLPRIFERFYRVDKGRSREHGGTGLGLAIVKHIIESHGQTIEVTSEEGKGTTFRFGIPKG